MSNIWNISQGYGSREYRYIINAFDQDSKIIENKSTAFHYTSFENCIKMLIPPNGNDYYLELFASHFSYMNDTQEFLKGLHLIIEQLNHISDLKNSQITETVNNFKSIFSDYQNIPYCAIPPHYIVSFNTECNNLAQWKYYGKNCGIAIEYDLNNCIFSNYKVNDTYAKHSSYYVNYDSVEQKTEISNILHKLDDLDSNSESNKHIHCKDILLKACAAASFIKDQNYKDEKEVRLLFAPSYQDDSNTKTDENRKQLMNKVYYRPRGTEYIIPYLKIRVKSKDNNQYPIKSLTVGPGQNQELIFKSLIMFIQSNFPKTQSDIKTLKDEFGCLCVEVNGIKIRRSCIPFRG